MFLIALLHALSSVALADSPDLGVPSLSHWWQLYTSLGQWVGIIVVFAVCVIVQVVMFLSRGEYAFGLYKILAVTGLTLFFGVFGLRFFVGMDLGAAVAHSLSIAAAQVYSQNLVMQIIKYVYDKRGDA
jgi:amino acid permease